MKAAILLVFCLPALAVAQSAITAGEAGALKRQGYVFYEGRWRLPQEIVYLQRAASRRLTASPPAAPVPAKASPAPLPRVAAHAGRPQLHRKATGIFTIRLQHSELLGMDTVPVSLGTGTARLQLPRTQSVSIGTTVGLPLR
jgi:hypothetical protein